MKNRNGDGRGVEEKMKSESKIKLFEGRYKKEKDKK